LRLSLGLPGDGSAFLRSGEACRKSPANFLNYIQMKTCFLSGNMHNEYLLIPSLGPAAPIPFLGRLRAAFSLGVPALCVATARAMPVCLGRQAG
jgi:hypothetical protein